MNRKAEPTVAIQVVLTKRDAEWVAEQARRESRTVSGWLRFMVHETRRNLDPKFGADEHDQLPWRLLPRRKGSRRIGD